MANIRMRVRRGVEVGKTDIEFAVADRKGVIGTLTLSKGTLDWRPKGAKSGKAGECRLSWRRLDVLLQAFHAGELRIDKGNSKRTAHKRMAGSQMLKGARRRAGNRSN